VHQGDRLYSKEKWAYCPHQTFSRILRVWTRVGCGVSEPAVDISRCILHYVCG